MLIAADAPNVHRRSDTIPSTVGAHSHVLCRSYGACVIFEQVRAINMAVLQELEPKAA